MDAKFGRSFNVSVLPDAAEVVALIDDCFHRAVIKSSVAGATVYVHREPTSTEAQAGSLVALTVELDHTLGRLIVTALGVSSVEHMMLDFVLMPVHKFEEKKFTGPPVHMIQQHGARFESKAQSRTAHGNRPRKERSSRDPTNRRYTPSAAPAPAVRLLSRAQLGLRKLIQKQRPRPQARNALDEAIQVIIPDVESDSDTSSATSDQ